MRHKKESLRIFESDFLERFTFVHPLTPLMVWMPVIAWLIYRAISVHGLAWWMLGGFAASGLLVWTLTENLHHRYVFHWKGETYLEKRFYFIMHGNHHDDPNDPWRLVMPPLPAFAIAGVLFLGFRPFLGPVYVEPFFAFFLLGYLWYDYTHYYVHHFNPKTRWGKMVKQHHMMHHFVTPEAKWGVSSPLWDVLLGSLSQADRPRKEKPQTA